jgi:RNA polymerase sigma-70 factor, ECF subfamily
MHFNNEILMSRVARGDRAAFEILYDRHAATVLSILLQITGEPARAEVILQETFWQVWKSADTYPSQDRSFTSWLFRIARSLAMDSYSRQNVHPKEIMGMTNFDQASDSKNVLAQAQSDLNTERARNMLRRLPHEQRQILEMAYFRGMTRQEIAAATGEALDSISSLARLGLQKIHEALETGEANEVIPKLNRK